MEHFRKLKGRMREMDVDQRWLAKKLGRSLTYLSWRMTGKVPFTMQDAYTICSVLEIPHDQLLEYFPQNGKQSQMFRPEVVVSNHN